MTCAAKADAPHARQGGEANAEDVPSNQAIRHAGASLGFSIQRIADDLAVGGQASTPAFLRHMLRFTGAGGVAWYPHATDSAGQEAWKPFGHARLTLEIGPPDFVGAPLRPYGFAGAQVLFLPDSLSSESIAVGAVGGFGFELEIRYPREPPGTDPVSFFVELGATGNAARADRLADHPAIANGFVMTAGLRAYLF
jgi:hypothetical protein